MDTNEQLDSNNDNRVNEPGDLNPYYSGSPKFESRLTLLQERAPNMRTTMIIRHDACALAVNNSICLGLEYGGGILKCGLGNSESPCSYL